MTKLVSAAALFVGAIALSSLVNAAEPITLTIMSTTAVADPEKTAEQKVADAFMAEHPDIKVEFIPVNYPDYSLKISTAATSGDVPDIFANGPEFATKLADFGIVADLKPLLGDDFIKGFDQNVLKESYVNGELAYAPYYFIAISLIYRTDLLEAAGLKPPTTWDEFIKDAQVLTVDKDGDGQIDQWGFAMVGAANTSGGSRFVPVLRAFGAAELESDGSGGWKTTINSPGGIAALQLWGDLVNKYKVVPPGALTTAYPDALALMSSGKAAMFFSGAHAIGGILNNGAKDLKGKFSSVPYPAGPGGTPQTSLGQLGYSIAKNSPHQKEAVEYLKFFLSKQNQINFTLATGRIPVRLDALQSPEIQVPQYQGFINSTQYAYVTPPAPFYIATQLIAADAYQAVINGTPAAEAAATAEARIKEEIAKNE